MTKTKRILTAMCAAMMALTVASCGNDTSSSSDSGSTTASTAGGSEGTEGGSTGTCQDTGCVWDAYTPYEETVTFTKGATKPQGYDNYPEGDDLLNNHYTRYVKEQINVQPELAWEVDANNYGQKVSLSISTGDIPDIMIVDRTIFKQLVENDLVADLTEAYEKCISPFLKDVYDTYGNRIFEEVTVDGKLMGIPGTQIYGQNYQLLWIRQDWLDEVGMEAPTTVEEIYDVAKAFIDNDLGGNGKTVGITGGEEIYKNSAFLFTNVFYSYGAYLGQWVERDGKMVYGSTLPEVKEALAELSRWYADGIIDREFAVRKDVDRQALISSGQTGMVFSNWWPDASLGESVVNDQNAEWIPVVAPLNENGNLTIPEFDPVNQILVVSKDYEHPEAIIKTLNAEYDILRGNGEEGWAAYEKMNQEAPTLNWGVCPIGLQIDRYDAIEYLTYDLQHALEVGDKSVMENKSQSANYDVIVAERENPKTDGGRYTQTIARTIGSEAIISDQVVMEEKIPFFGKTETMSTKWANLEKLEIETFVKIITGEKSVDYFDEFVTTWNQMGGEDITKEVQAEVDAKG